MQRDVLAVRKQANLQTTTSGRKNNKSLRGDVVVYFIAPNLSAYDLSGREACMMDEMITVYYVAYTVFFMSVQYPDCSLSGERLA